MVRSDVRWRFVRDAYKRLRAYETRWIDLTYPAGDPRAAKPDSEMAPHEIATRDALRADIVCHAALAAGETLAAARCHADQPLAADNPYRLERVQLALSLRWSIQQWMLDRARRVLLAREAERARLALDPLQAATERLVL